MHNLLADDLDHVLDRTASIWEDFRRASVFVSGGTGFFGCWLLESALHANQRLKLGMELTVLARDYRKFVHRAPHLATHPKVRFLQGDVRDFEFPEGRYSHIIHAATDSTLKLTPENRALVSETIVDGTARMLSFAKSCGTRRFLFVSSGAVYGPQPSTLAAVPETYAGAEPSSSYAQGKRVAEELCLGAKGLEIAIARCFAFVGPHLPLDAHFAVGNFIGDVLAGHPIRVSGDGTPLRSYMYAADLAVWLWTILVCGRPGRAYNVGSEHAVSIAELAHTVGRASDPQAPVFVSRHAVPGTAPQRYVPSTVRAREELGLDEWFSLDDSIRRTVRYHRLQAEADTILEGSTWQTFRSATRSSATIGPASSSRNSESTTTAA
jgi:dTDP-glucose 4,6-dehydratase